MKFYWDKDTLISLCSVYDCFQATKLNSCDIDYLVSEPENIHSLALDGFLHCKDKNHHPLICLLAVLTNQQTHLGRKTRLTSYIPEVAASLSFAYTEFHTHTIFMAHILPVCWEMYSSLHCTPLPFGTLTKHEYPATYSYYSQGECQWLFGKPLSTIQLPQPLIDFTQWAFPRPISLTVNGLPHWASNFTEWPYERSESVEKKNKELVKNSDFWDPPQIC